MATVQSNAHALFAFPHPRRLSKARLAAKAIVAANPLTRIELRHQPEAGCILRHVLTPADDG